MIPVAADAMSLSERFNYSKGTLRESHREWISSGEFALNGIPVPRHTTWQDFEGAVVVHYFFWFEGVEVAHA